MSVYVIRREGWCENDPPIYQLSKNAGREEMEGEERGEEGETNGNSLWSVMGKSRRRRTSLRKEGREGGGGGGGGEGSNTEGKGRQRDDHSH